MLEKLLAQIETERGLAQLEDIARVPGIDVLWLGHFDLSNFMGIPAQFNHPDFNAAMARIASVARAHSGSDSYVS